MSWSCSLEFTLPVFWFLNFDEISWVVFGSEWGEAALRIASFPPVNQKVLFRVSVVVLWLVIPLPLLCFPQTGAGGWNSVGEVTPESVTFSTPGLLSVSPCPLWCRLLSVLECKRAPSSVHVTKCGTDSWQSREEKIKQTEKYCLTHRASLSSSDPIL